MENILLFADALIAISLLALAIVSLLKQGHKNSVNLLFAQFSVSIAVFIVSNDLCNNTAIPSHIALYIMYVIYISGSGAGILLMQFVMQLVGDPKLNNLVKRVLWPLWAIAAIGATPLVVSGVEVVNNTYAEEFGPLIWLFTLGVLVEFGLIAYGMIFGLRHTTGIKKRQLVSTGIGLLITLPLAITFSLLLRLLTGIDVPSGFGTAPFLILAISLYYGVVRYHLFDIKSAAVRTLAYALSLTVLVVLYYLLITIISNIFVGDNTELSQNNLLSLSLIFGLLFVFQPIKTFFDRLTNKFFYRDYYDSAEFFARFNRILTSTTSMRNLLERASIEISATLKSEHACFFINKLNGHYITAGTPNHGQVPKEDAWKLQEAYAKKQMHGVIVAPLLGEDDPIRHIMNKHKVELIMPLIQGGVVGYLCLGEHRTSRYTSRDIKVLGTVADELIIAIQNTLSIEEVRASNALLRQLDRAKDEFVSIASHELRTPMTVIRGFIGLLYRGQLGPLTIQQKEVVEKINNNTKTLIGLVNDMLDLAKLQADKLEITLSDNPIDVLVNNAFDKMQILYNGKGIALKYIGPNVLINTDPEKFEHIMLNLLSNAYKFTQTGGSVTVTSKIDEDKHLATICITDTGIGIPPEAIGNLFKKFSQVENYLQRQTGGSGLGLSICKQMVERLGGTIWVKSNIGVGSQFYFTMPLKENS